MKINSINHNNYSLKKQRNNNSNINQQNKNVLKHDSYMDIAFYLPFCARVDKSSPSFFERNKDTMPQTVKTFLKQLNQDEISELSPLEIQALAFEDLLLCENSQDVKDLFPNEPLFSDLVDSSKSNAKRGFIYEVNLMRDDIIENGEEIINTKDDLTIYLLKKVFLEGKTLDEINKDLDKDINPFLKRDDKKYIQSSTLASLGIKLPDNRYSHSLLYTQEGYSDKIGKIISDRWNSLSDEEKEKRRENMLINRTGKTIEVNEKLRAIRSKRMKERWDLMSPSQKAEYIQKMQEGSEENKITMISAWNKCPVLREELSKFLILNNFSKPQNVIYKDTPYSETMSKIMLEFWENHEDEADELGRAIISSREEYEKAKEQNLLNKFIEKTLNDQKIAKQSIKELSIQFKEKVSKNREFSFIDEFKKEFPYIPKDIMQEIDAIINSHSFDNPYEVKRLFLKAASGEKIDGEFEKHVLNLIDTSLQLKDDGGYSPLLLAISQMTYEALDNYNGIKIPYKFDFGKTTIYELLTFTKSVQNNDYKKYEIHENIMDNRRNFINIFTQITHGVLPLLERYVDDGNFSVDYFRTYKYIFKSKPKLENINKYYKNCTRPASNKGDFEKFNFQLTGLDKKLNGIEDLFILMKNNCMINNYMYNDDIFSKDLVTRFARAALKTSDLDHIPSEDRQTLIQDITTNYYYCLFKSIQDNLYDKYGWV